MHYLFFFTDTTTTEIYTLSLHDALPISPGLRKSGSTASSTGPGSRQGRSRRCSPWAVSRSKTLSTSPFRATPKPISDRKSTRLNSSHTVISYAVFCLKKKKKKKKNQHK